MRRQIRRTAEQSLAQNPIFTAPPATPLYHSAPPEVSVARLGADNPNQTPASAAVSAPKATTAEVPRPPVQVEPAPPSSASSGETSDPSQPASRTPRPPTPSPAPDAEQDEWQLPQWQYTSKRARVNQQQEQRKNRR